MQEDIIIDQDAQKVNNILGRKTGNVGQNLTADEAGNVFKLFEEGSHTRWMTVQKQS